MNRVTRRRFVLGAGTAGLTLVAGCRLPFAAAPARVYRVAFLGGSPPSPSGAAQMAAFREGLRTLGYVEGQNLSIDERRVNGDDQLAGPAAELAGLRPDVILVAGSIVARIVQDATTTIPIVSVSSGIDLVASGAAASHARPGTNVTGLSTPFLGAKQLELLKETIPTLSRVAVLFDTTVPDYLAAIREPYETAGRSLGLQIQFVGARGVEELEPAFDAAGQGRADGLLLVTAPAITANQMRIAELALQRRLPSMWQQTEAVGRGGLIGYGPNRVDLYRRAATFVDRILKGARPADLPVEQPTVFDFVVNLKTAGALGLTIPPSVLDRATEVIR